MQKADGQKADMSKSRSVKNPIFCPNGAENVVDERLTRGFPRHFMRILYHIPYHGQKSDIISYPISFLEKK
jgi:hypothetical protein